MRISENLKAIQITFLISVLVHICLFLSLRYPTSESKISESRPIDVEFFTTPETSEKAAGPSPSAKKVGSGVTSYVEKHDRLVPVPQPVEKVIRTPAPDTSYIEKASGLPAPAPEEHPKAIEATAPTTPAPSDTTSVSPPLPGIKELIPSPFELAGKETGKSVTSDIHKPKDEETISLEEPDLRYESYVRGVGLKIEGVWKYPEAAKRSALEGNGLISFTLNRTGDLIDVKLLTSSGYPILDEAIVEAVRKAAPFNPFQENMPIKRLNIIATFQYHLVSPGYIWIR